MEHMVGACLLREEVYKFIGKLNIGLLRAAESTLNIRLHSVACRSLVMLLKSKGNYEGKSTQSCWR